MRLAVRDIDILDLPPDFEPTGDYQGALVLIRVAGRPCGQAVIAFDTEGGKTPIKERILSAAGSSVFEAWLRHRLALPDPSPRPSQLPKASVVICTRDRTEDLERCLIGLLAMPDKADILVVDNAPSNDATRDLVSRFNTVRYLREPRPGLDVARNTALRNARADVVAFIDDDAVPDPLWLRTLLRNFEDPLVLAVTGLTMAAELETDSQIAFQHFGGFCRGFRRQVYDAHNLDPFTGWHAGAGVNMALRRTIVDAVGWFDEALDAGTLSLAGGDTDMFRRVLEAGYRIIYDPEALNWHRHRRSSKELQQQMYGYEAASFAILTKALVFEGNPRALPRMVRSYIRLLRRVFQRRQTHQFSLPYNDALTQFRGAASGPVRYLRARARAAKAGHKDG
ncbi:MULTISPECIES: glycosyltransferase [Rhizobium]|uniref:glycosyltransferase family 2 protein n=1 Tax=Rhizobium TaxID=379 RepID=UPI001B340E7C|nr:MULTISPECIES: glycosyltransferase [Rhizobium]MBX4908555.1 glycosyltransferase [Rhizobium bangladeshense]MBX5215857.1 glycosyltransferase [Rhizobium sp. NLR9a]MBX5230117.1 glycosyltransferase [Rhizobium sp. NLR9b]MBX5233772.1 glycosyltransferase [Rhizobium sp. NLR4a]MBX5242201.1 glycosyltransferase [Rhizobium sp. NLR22b]